MSDKIVTLKSIDGRLTTECPEKYAKALEASGKYVRISEEIVELSPLRPAGSADMYGVPRAEEDAPEPVEEPTPPKT